MEPALITDIVFKWPKRPKLTSSSCKDVQKEVPPGNAVTQPEAETTFLSNLKEVFLSAAIFSSVLRKPSTDIHTPVVQKLPSFLTSLHNLVCNKMTPEQLDAECEAVFGSHYKRNIIIERSYHAGNSHSPYYGISTVQVV